jgi:phosphatidylserine/phosphatidylglycerophosphate/cardiolipin synthase-like enzyme
MTSARPNRPTILRPGRNCWTADAAVTASGLLVDADDYYAAFYEAAVRARKYLLIAGWRFNSTVRLLRGAAAERAGGEAQFLPFLNGLCAANPDLHVYLLAWDFSINYALEWELFQERKFDHDAHPRMHFLFDSNHAVGASHHQKFVVADGRLAFVGGLDFCADDWDDRRHLADQPLRAEPDGHTHGPYHDIQTYLVGAAAVEVAAYFRRRWHDAGGGDLDLPSPPPGPPPAVKPSVVVRGNRIALSRNQPATLAVPETCHEIKHLYLDAIAAADELVYMENQYFSSQAVYQALLDRLGARDRSTLDVVLVLPKQLPSWVEAAAMETPRAVMIEGLREAAQRHDHRLGIYYTAATGDDGQEVPVLIHSKVLLVDDRFLTVGSANASNRSMGLDSELNVSWEATGPGDGALVRSIRRVRQSLLAEHAGLCGRADLRRSLRQRRGLVETLDRLASGNHSRLRPLTRETLFEDRAWLKALEALGFSFDPKKPMEESLYEALSP